MLTALGPTPQGMVTALGPTPLGHGPGESALLEAYAPTQVFLTLPEGRTIAIVVPCSKMI